MDLNRDLQRFKGAADPRFPLEEEEGSVLPKNGQFRQMFSSEYR